MFDLAPYTWKATGSDPATLKNLEICYVNSGQPFVYYRDAQGTLVGPRNISGFQP